MSILDQYGISQPRIYRNLSQEKLNEYILKFKKGLIKTFQDALTIRSGKIKNPQQNTENFNKRRK